MKPDGVCRVKGCSSPAARDMPYRSTTIDALLWSWISMLQEMSSYKAGYLQHGPRFAIAR